MKRVFILAAHEQLSKSEEEINVSRLSALTGLHRRDIKKIIEIGNIGPKKLRASVTARVLSVWETGPEYRDGDGEVRDLSFKGAESEFSELAKRVSSDLNVGTVLLELERQKAVVRKGDKLRLRRGLSLCTSDLEQGFSLLGSDIDELIQSVEQNLITENENRNLHITTRFDKIPVAKEDYVRSWLREEGSKFHRKVREFLSKHDVDCAGEKTSEQEQYVEVVVGAFSRTHSEEVQQVEPEKEAV